MEKYTHVPGISCGFGITTLPTLKRDEVRLHNYSDEGIPECMPEPYKRRGIVEAYQLYYMVEKMSFARYKNVVK